MTMTVALRKMVHRKTPEFLTPNPAGNTVAGGFICTDKSDIVPGHDSAFYVGGVSAIWRYNADEDGWMQAPSSGATGTFAAGACGDYRAISAPGGSITLTPTGGTTSRINTNLNIITNLAGKKILITAGPNAGLYTDIISNTIGTNAVITVATQAAAFTAASLFRMYAGSLWFFNSGTVAVSFSVYDVATNVWSARSVAGLPTAWGTDGALVSTGALMSNDGDGFDNGTATAGGATTLTCVGKTWPVNGWTDSEVRILSGTGAGQIRSIASNTATVLTVSAAWATNPDATSTFGIFGNSDYFYLLGNNAVTMYRYSISGNAWTTLAPTVARGGNLTNSSANWIDNVQDADWNDGTYGPHNSAGTILKQNGRYIYSFRGGGGANVDIYDIAANTWINDILYGGRQESFGGGAFTCDVAGKIYIHKEGLTGRIFVFDVGKNKLTPFTTSPMPQGTGIAGNKMMIQTYREGADEIRWLYVLSQSRAELTRWLTV